MIRCLSCPHSQLARWEVSERRPPLYRYELTEVQRERIALFFPDRYHHGGPAIPGGSSDPSSMANMRYLTPRDDSNLGAVLWIEMTSVSARRWRSRRPLNPVFLRVVSSSP